MNVTNGLGNYKTNKIGLNPRHLGLIRAKPARISDQKKEDHQFQSC